MRVTLPFGLHGMNEQLDAKGAVFSSMGNRRRSAYTGQKKKCTEAVARELIKQGCVPDEPYMIISLSYIWYEKDRRRDPDNIRAQSKEFLDGMVLAGVIKNDGFNNIASIKDRFCVSEDKTRRVEASWEVIK